MSITTGSSAPANAARPCTLDDVEILISPRLFAGQLPGPNPAAYRGKCSNCGAEQGRITADPNGVIYLTERAAQRWAALHAGGVAG